MVKLKTTPGRAFYMGGATPVRYTGSAEGLIEALEEHVVDLTVQGCRPVTK